jgi:hypothetical protein
VTTFNQHSQPIPTISTCFHTFLLPGTEQLAKYTQTVSTALSKYETSAQHNTFKQILITFKYIPQCHTALAKYTPASKQAGERQNEAADTQISMLPGIPGSAMCVQNLHDSRGPAIRITYRISLRSSSLWEPRHPLLKVVKTFYTLARLQSTPALFID